MIVINNEDNEKVQIPSGYGNYVTVIENVTKEYHAGKNISIDADRKISVVGIEDMIDSRTEDFINNEELERVLDNYTTEEDVVNLIDAETGDYIDADELAAVLDDYALKTSLDGKVDKDNYLYKALLDNAAKWNKAAFAIDESNATLNLYKFDGSYAAGVAVLRPATTEKAGLMSTAMYEQLNNAASKEYVDSIVGVINNQLESI